MLRSRLIGSITSPGISSILSLNDSNRLLVAKKNGDIEVYSNDQDKNSNISQFKLFQTYSNLLRNLPNASNLDLTIKDLLYSKELNTIFIKCKCLLVLLNSTNLHLYDKIYDKRGIKQAWIKTTLTSSSTITSDDGNVENSMTFLIYTTTKSNKLRILIWVGRIYKQMLEISLPKQSTDPMIKSLGIVLQGQSLLFTMSSGVYLWNFKSMALHNLNKSKSSSHSTISTSNIISPYLVKIDKVFTKKYPDNVVDAITSLKDYTTNGLLSPIDNSSITSNDSKQTKHRFWGSSHKTTPSFEINQSKEIRYIFKPHSNDNILILDGMTQNLLVVNINETNELNKLIAMEKKQFFQWNNKFNHFHYMSSDLLMLHNENTIKFVDYNNGFTFLQETIGHGIKQIVKLPGIFYLVWTQDDQLLLYTYQVDDDDEQYEPSTIANSCNTSRTNLTQMTDTQSTDSEFSICGMYHDSSFYQLWRKVLFYRFFLESPFALQLCVSDDPQESLDICAMKLRDLTVMWCLQMFATLQNSMNKLISNDSIAKKKDNNNIIEYLNKIEEVVIRDIFNFFIVMWAPPQLIIVKTFPPEISYLVAFISQQEHKCHDAAVSPQDSEKKYKINPNLIQKWVLPYLTDMRRHLRNLLAQQEQSKSNGTITWNYENRHIPQDLDFFLLDRHGSIHIETMLTLLETVLFKTYILYIPSMVGPLIRVENLCDKSVVIKDLKKMKMFHELIDFYYQRKMHHDALEFLFNELDNEENQDEVNQPDLTIKYLKRLPNKNLKDLFHYLSKLIDTLQDVEIRNNIIKSIFENTSPVNLKRDNLKVYQFIDKIDKSLSLEYLEFIIHTIKDINPEMFANLVARYISQLTDVNMDKLEEFLKSNLQYNPNEILHILEVRLLNATVPFEDKQFIELLQIYPLYRLNSHEKSIDILFNKLNDYKRASDYCYDVYSNDAKIGSSVLLYLLHSIIKNTYPGEDQTINTDQLFTFLQDHRDKLNIVEVLKALPTDFPLKDIKNFLIYSIRNEKMNNESLSLKKNVLQVELTNVKYSINHKSSAFIEVNSNNTCKVCNRNFHSLSTESVYWFTMPNGKEITVHYNCGKALENRLQNTKQRSSNAIQPMNLTDLKKYMYSDNN
ncbi:vacuolar morphogenesis protein 6 [Monosporozyma unispora]|nr:Vacuolar morphogenesis protein 6 [Kazachstania unispora]